MVAGPDTVQKKMPELGAEGDIVVQVAPESRDISIFTCPPIPTEVQVILWVLPAIQLSPPLGAVTTIMLLTLIIEKSVLLVSDTPGKAMLETLTLA